MFRDTNNTGTTVLRNMEKMKNECPTKQIKSVKVVTIACSCEGRCVCVATNFMVHSGKSDVNFIIMARAMVDVDIHVHACFCDIIMHRLYILPR